MVNDNNNIQITDIKIQLSEGFGYVKGWATIVINDAIAIHNIGIVSCLDGLFLSFPCQPIKDIEDKREDIVHPTNIKVRNFVTEEVVKEYNRVRKEE